MQLPPSDHIVWKIIRQLIIGVVFCVMSAINYKNGFDIKDIGTLLALWSAVAGFDIAKTKATEEKE